MSYGDFHEEYVKIQCPQCNCTCNALVQWWDNFPFVSYVHRCEHYG